MLPSGGTGSDFTPQDDKSVKTKKIKMILEFKAETTRN